MDFLLSIIPIVLMFILVLKFKMTVFHAALLSFLCEVLIITTYFDFGILNVGTAILNGTAKSFFSICMVIIGALICHKMMEETGGYTVVKSSLTSVTADKRILVLLIAWGFGGFMEGIAGFGTALIMPVILLVSLGFEPIESSVICLAANTAPVAFGAVGIPVTVLGGLGAVDGVGGLETGKLSVDILAQLFILDMFIPFLLVFLCTKSINGAKGIAGRIFMASLVSFIAQFAVAYYLGEQLPAIVGSIVFMVAILVGLKDSNFSQFDGKFVKAILPYIIAIILILFTSTLFPTIKSAVSVLVVPEFTYMLHGVEKVVPTKMELLNTPGMFLVIAALIGALVNGMNIGRFIVLCGETLWSIRKTIITVITFVIMSVLTDYSGMALAISAGFVLVFGKAYAFVAPLLGGLGTFVTGSDTSSNLLFGNTQLHTAKTIGADLHWIVGSNTSGAAVGKAISPQSISIVCSATKLEGSEPKILSESIKIFAILMVLVMAVVGIVGVFYK